MGLVVPPVRMIMKLNCKIQFKVLDLKKKTKIEN